MTSKGELDRFIGKTISIWCGEYDGEGRAVIHVVRVEQVKEYWIVGTILSKEHPGMVWYNIRQIAFFFEGDYFEDKKEHIEVVLSRRD